MSPIASSKSKSRKQREATTVSKSAPISNTTKLGEPFQRVTAWVVAIAVFLLVFGGYLPTLWNDFVHWQGKSIFIENSDYRGLDWKLLQWLLTSSESPTYGPLNWFLFAGDTLFWGADPFGYHLTSLMIHSANGVIFYFICYRLFLLADFKTSPNAYALNWGACLAALFFGLHPLRAEPVGWISARNDLLGGCFFLSALFCYLTAFDANATRRYRRQWMMVSCGFYAFSLFSSTSGLSFPIGLMILDVYPLRRAVISFTGISRDALRTLFLEKWPFLLIAALAWGLGVFPHGQGGFEQNVLSRIGLFAYSASFYLIQTFLATSLSTAHELPAPPQMWHWSYTAAIAVVLVITLLAYVLRRRWPAILTAWAWYLVVLFPLFAMPLDVDRIVSDRDTYLSCLSFAVMVGAGSIWCRAALTRQIFKESFVFGSLLLTTMTLAPLAWSQVQVWHDAETLLRYAVDVGPESRYARKNLADVLSAQGREDDVMDVYTGGVRRNPKSASAHVDLGHALAKRLKLEESARSYMEALELDPAFGEAHVGVGTLMMQRGNYDQAAEHFHKALGSHPANVDAHVSLGISLVVRGNFREATEHYKEALRLDPSNANAYFNLANVHAVRGDTGEAIRNYRLTLRMNAKHSEAHFNLANALAETGELTEAMKHYQEAVRINPDFAEAYHNRGRVLAAQGELGKAIEQFQQAVAARPDFAEAHTSLSQALGEQGRIHEAKKHHQEANRIMNMNRRPSAAPAGSLR